MDLELFKTYEKIRQSGKYNMLMDWQQVMLEMKLNPRHKADKQKYMAIIANYTAPLQQLLSQKSHENAIDIYL